MHLHCFSNFMKISTSVQFSCSVVCDSLQSHGLKYARLSCPSATPEGFTNACNVKNVFTNASPLSWWCHSTISSSVVPVSSRLQTFPESVFSNESVLHIRWPKYWSFSFHISPCKNIQDWFPLGWTGWISLQKERKGRWSSLELRAVQLQ